MIENNLLSYLNIGLPEDILRMKLHGDFDGAVRLIDRKLSDPALPDPLRYCLMAEREMILRMPSDYPFTREDALKKIRTRIPDFTEDEFDHYLSIGQIRWIYVNGEMRIFDRFFESMCKSMPDFRKRTAVTLDGSESAGKGSRGDLRLNRAMEIMKEKGSLSNRIRIRASVKVKDSAFTPEMFVRVHLPIPAACDQQSDIRIESVFPENAKIAPEDAPQRTICWEETLKENHEFSVQYSYVHTAVWHDTESALKKSDACKTFGTEVNPGTVSQEQTLSAGLNHKAAETVQLYAHSSNESSSSSLREFEVGVSDDLAELAPHIVFTPYIRALAAELSKGCETPLEKARNFYDFITLNFKYTYMPAYFSLEDIPGNCARTFTGTAESSHFFLSPCAAAPESPPSGRADTPQSRTSSAVMTGFASTPPRSAGSTRIPLTGLELSAPRTRNAAASISETLTHTAWSPTAPFRHLLPSKRNTGAPIPTITS